MLQKLLNVNVVHIAQERQGALDINLQLHVLQRMAGID